jgi:hypothetical protein
MHRENSYTVLKNEDIAAYLSDKEREELDDLCRKINRFRLLSSKAIIQCIVIESDCPEHEKFLEMIADHFNGF